MNTSRFENRFYFGSICLFAIINPLIAQIGWHFFPDGIKGLSLMKWFQGIFFLYMIATLPLLRKYSNIYSKKMFGLLVLFTAGFIVIHFRVWAAGSLGNEDVMTERVFYFKIIFALTLCYFATLVVRNAMQSETLLKCLVWGSVLTSICIFYFYINGESSVAAYSAAGIKASVGAGGVTGKDTVGYLVPGIFITLYLSTKNNSGYGVFVALFILAASYLTYGRSGQVAFCFALAWLLFWYLFISEKRKNYSIILTFAALMLVTGILYFKTYGYEQLVSRWTHDLSRGELGSGRIRFYTVALKWFVKDSSITEIFLGMGFGNIHQLMFKNCGMYIHTHSDFFDMMLAGGLLGLILYASLLYYPFHWAGKIKKECSEYGYLLALSFAFCTMSLITGQLGAPHVVFTVLVSNYCMLSINTKVESISHLDNIK